MECIKFLKQQFSVLFLGVYSRSLPTSAMWLRSTDIVWQEVWSSILAVDWVASFTMPILPLYGPLVILIVVPMMSRSRDTLPRPAPPPRPPPPPPPPPKPPTTEKINDYINFKIGEYGFLCQTYFHLRWMGALEMPSSETWIPFPWKCRRWAWFYFHLPAASVWFYTQRYPHSAGIRLSVEKQSS